jgi:hypothetical protein
MSEMQRSQFIEFEAWEMMLDEARRLREGLEQDVVGRLVLIEHDHYWGLCASQPF